MTKVTSLIFWWVLIVCHKGMGPHHSPLLYNLVGELDLISPKLGTIVSSSYSLSLSPSAPPHYTGYRHHIFPSWSGYLLQGDVAFEQVSSGVLSLSSRRKCGKDHPSLEIISQLVPLATFDKLSSEIRTTSPTLRAGCSSGHL